ncbi:hypothetical protein [Synechocystis sp. PCC 7509]|uniref:hypothetical protein n=1 Tax=Synechocystis sp. PCC 7509 TaxID=927677 RepID=UPI0002ABCD5F|nr:hypothetical protein [Synechocystis sp. PCC 7509]
MAQNSLQLLNVGNVVTTAFQLFKNRFKPYFLLAFKAYFWLLVPVYGWAKFFAISALISRLVYSELTNQPETISGGEKYVNSKLWQFLVTSVLLAFIALSIWIVLLIVLAIIFTVIVLVFSGSISSLQPGEITNTVISIIMVIISTIGSMLLLIRFVISELPLAIEDNINATSTIRRSWKLTKDFGSNILLIYCVAFLITLPLLALSGSVYYLMFQDFTGSFLITYPLSAWILLAVIVRRIFEFLLGGIINKAQIINLLLIILSLCLSIVVGAIQLPFWQTVKAVVYYDLRTQKEGLGLNLRDRNI